MRNGFGVTNSLTDFFVLKVNAFDNNIIVFNMEQ